ncbi:MAG: hypothetical protein ACJ71L_06610, partial [Nitrososphaeraceae archaeon]
CGRNRQVKMLESGFFENQVAVHHCIKAKRKATNQYIIKQYTNLFDSGLSGPNALTTKGKNFFS